jgi:hypothetical protein
MTRRHLSIRSGNKAHPAAEALTVDFSSYVNSTRVGEWYSYPRDACSLLLPCHLPSQTASERAFFHISAEPTTVENLALNQLLTE